jgi:integrase
LYIYDTLADGSHPVKLRVTFEGDSRYFGLGVTSSVDNWNKESCRLIKDPKKCNLVINQKDVLAQNILLDFERDSIDFTFARFEAKFVTSKSPRDVFSFLEQRISDLESEERLSTAQSYRDLMYRLEDYKGDKETAKRRIEYSLAKRDGRSPQPYRRPPLTFHDISDISFLEEFQSFLAKRNSKSTIGIYLRTLRALINLAERKKVIKEDMNPFSTGFKIGTVVSGKIKSLTNEQILAFKSFDAFGKVKEDIDYFILSYYLDGSNLTDLAELEWKKHLLNGRIVYQRSKTDKLLDIEVTDQVAEIITNYSGNDPYILNVLEPGLTPKEIRNRVKSRLKRINKTLKRIAPLIGVPSEITFYWARHSFAARLYNKGVSVSVISEMMSHSDSRTTKTYIGRLDKTHLDEVRKYL